MKPRPRRWPIPWQGSPAARAHAALGWAIASVLVFTLLVVAGRVAVGDGLRPAVRAAAALEARSLRQESNADSWGPMVSAHRRLTAPAEQAVSGAPPAAVPRSLYADTLGEDGCKFQYPPSALLLVEVLPAAPVARYRCSTEDGGNDHALLGADPWPTKRWVDAAARLALLGTLATAAFGLRAVLAGRPGRDGAGPAWPTWALIGIAGLVFYPLAKAYSLGQIQVFLTLFTSLAVLAVLRGQMFAAGLLIGACTLVKPQLALLLVWALLRRERGFAAGLVLVAGIGHAWAWWRFGTTVHVDYIRTLAMLSQHGEVFWANQSVNGLLNRWFGTGEPALWDGRGFPPYHPVVRWATFASSLAIVGAALWFGRHRQGPLARGLDFCAMVAAATIASPIAWEHHYGGFIVLWAVALGAAVMLARPSPAWTAALIASYALMANALLLPELFFANRWTGLLASHLWAGALLLFGVLLALQRRAARG